MDFESMDSPEMAKFREEVRGVLKEIVPKDIMISADPKKNNDEQYELHRELARRMGNRGWLYPTVPKEFGGAGLTVDHAIVISEELDEYELTAPSYSDSTRLIGPDIYVWGTEEQKTRWLPDMYTAKVVSWQLLTEPHGGSDLASAKTTAIRDGDDYVLNGTKTFVGADRKPDWMWTLVMTDPKGPRHQNLSWIMVPADLPGITIQPLDLLSHGGGGGFMSLHNNSVFFEDVHVPATNLVGGENNGWKVATTHLELEHGGGGSISRNRTIERFLAYCRSAKINGEPVIGDPSAQDILANIIMEEDVDRLFGMRNFWQRHARIRGTYEGSQSSYFRKMGGLRVSYAMLNILGYLALTNDEEWNVAERWVEHYQRSTITAVHPGGTQDIQRVIMARRMGLGRTVREEAGQMD